jgi:hypothetical protein
MVLHQDGNYTQACDVTSGQDMTCILDADELDLFAQGLTLNYNVPAGMCSYMEMQPYFYYQYQPGIGPSKVFINITSATGVVTETDSNDGFPAASGASTTKTTVQTPYSATPTCTADYTGVGGPNCCFGKYTLSVTTDNASASVSDQDWGGSPSNCLAGPGKDSQIPNPGQNGDITTGYPERTLFTLDGISLNSNYIVNSPLAKNFSSNAYVSNFWQSGIPGDYPLTNDGVATGSPNAMQGPGLTAGIFSSGCYGTLCSGNPWYEFDCLDPAKDLVARIRVLVRSWTYDANFKSFVANQTSTPANGTYNYYGSELPPFADQPIEDIETWVTPFSGTLGAGTTGAVNAKCYNSGTPTQDCGFGSMFPGLGN